MQDDTDPTRQVRPDESDEAWDRIMSEGFSALLTAQDVISAALNEVAASAGNEVRARLATAEALRNVATAVGAVR